MNRFSFLNSAVFEIKSTLNMTGNQHCGTSGKVNAFNMAKDRARENNTTTTTTSVRTRQSSAHGGDDFHPLPRGPQAVLVITFYQTQQTKQPRAPKLNRLVGQVVKASERKIRGSIPACDKIFPGRVIPVA